MHALASRCFKDKVREKQQADKQERILDRTADRLIGIGHFDKRNSQRGAIKCAHRRTGTLGGNPTRNERYGPLSAEALGGDITFCRQEATIETWTRPVALCHEPRALSVSQNCKPLSARKAQVGGDVERCILLG